MPRDEYGLQWGKISKDIRKRAGYRCSKCQKDFSNNKQLLHVHHKDGVKWNHHTNNLKVLCFHCHKKEPGHSFQMRKAG